MKSLLVFIMVTILMLFMVATRPAAAYQVQDVPMQQNPGPDERVCYPQNIDTQAGTYDLRDKTNQLFTVGRTSGSGGRIVLILDCRVIARFAESYGAVSVSWENGYPIITSVRDGGGGGLRYRIDERYGFDQLSIFQNYVPQMNR